MVRCKGSTIRMDGATPKVHAREAVLTVSSAMRCFQVGMLDKAGAADRAADVGDGWRARGDHRADVHVGDAGGEWHGGAGRVF